MSEPSPADVSLPTTEQIVMASERAILGALDVTLLMAERTLRAEHITLGDDSDEPYPPHLAIAGSILLLAASLRELLAAYRAATDCLLDDA